MRSSEDEADAHANEQRRNVAAVAVARVLMREIEIDRERYCRWIIIVTHRDHDLRRS